jgi:hypothetical protein
VRVRVRASEERAAQKVCGVVPKRTSREGASEGVSKSANVYYNVLARNPKEIITPTIVADLRK